MCCQLVFAPPRSLTLISNNVQEEVLQGGGCLAEGGDVPTPFNTFSTSGGLSAADVHAPPPISFSSQVPVF